MTILFPPAPAPPSAQPTTEVVMLRRQTREFIKADMRLISLWRTEYKGNGTGGYVVDTLLDIFEQEMRLIPFSSLGMERARVDGTVVTPSWVLLGEYNSEMREGDRFFMPDGQVAEIVLVEEKRLYQTKGEVVLHGRPS
jgi:hypothetical protein